MKTLITGVPGSGKTLYAIQKLLLPLIGTKVRVEEDDGSFVEYEREIYTNINGLDLPGVICHQVEPGPQWTYNQTTKEWSQPPGNRLGWHNWHEWAKPGAILVPDEFQRIWPQRPNGAPTPPDISAMDTHRHMGVDFVEITQKFNFDGHIRGLIGRHLHVRRLGFLPVAIVYEWDACSHTLQYSKAMAKRPYRYDKKVYGYYKSARAHTTQPRSLPTLAYVVLAALGLAAWKIPETYARISGKVDQPRAAAAAPGKVPAQDRAPQAHGPEAAPAASLASFPAQPVEPSPTHLGCIKFGPRCECFSPTGMRIPVAPAICEEGSHKISYVLPASEARKMGEAHGKQGEGYPTLQAKPEEGMSYRPAPAPRTSTTTDAGTAVRAPKAAPAS